MRVRLFIRSLVVATLTVPVTSALIHAQSLPRSPNGAGPRALALDDATLRNVIDRTHPEVLTGAAENRVLWLFLNEVGSVVASGLSDTSSAANTSDMIPVAIGRPRKGGVFALPEGMSQRSRGNGQRFAELPLPATIAPLGVLTDSTNATDAALRRYKNGEMGPTTVTIVLLTVR